jgi:general secretion pathway protein K
VRRRNKQGGIAIITAILIMAIVATVAASLGYAQQLWLNQAQNLMDLSQAEMLHKAAMETAALALKEDGRKTTYDWLDKNEELWNNPAFVPIDKGTIAFTIHDAQGKFNLNNLVGRRSSKVVADQKALYKRLLRNHEIDNQTADELVDALIDWLDSNRETEPRGAEDPEYLNLNPPYRAANAALMSVDELRLVQGYTPAIVEKIRDDVTVLPIEMSPAGEGDQTITEVNVNTASVELISAWADITLAEAKTFLANVPFKKTDDVHPK